MTTQGATQGTTQGAADQRRVQRVCGAKINSQMDLVVVEEPLEIRLSFELDGQPHLEPLAVTMRTPGDDFILAAGFLLSEGVISHPEDIEALRRCRKQTKQNTTTKEEPDDSNNIVLVELAPDLPVDLKRLQRHLFTSSSCGICGKMSLEAVETIGASPLPLNPLSFPLQEIHRLSERMKTAQRIFERTGGLHAAARFDATGTLLDLREDIGRHNAVDKVIGEALLNDALPLKDELLMVSGRASFEIVQKALMAQVPILASVGAPSTLAIQLAERFNMTLIGFVREERFNIYTAPERLLEISS